MILMKNCLTCLLKYKRSIRQNHELPNAHLAANNQNYCQQGKKILVLADERSYLQPHD